MFLIISVNGVGNHVELVVGKDCGIEICVDVVGRYDAVDDCDLLG